MFADALQVDDESVVNADICIIGAGPAGLTLALELNGKGLKVLLLEAGRFDEVPERNDLSQLASGFQYGTVRQTANTQRFGGNASAWNLRTPRSPIRVRFARFRDVDFESRSETGSEAWPLQAGDLDSAARRASEHWNIAPDGFTPSEQHGVQYRLLDLGADVSNAAFQFPVADTLTVKARAILAASANVSVLLNAVATDLQFEGARVIGARIVTRPGHGFRVQAGRFVVAAGAFNACKLLFASRMPNGHAPGNAQDVLGRYFMDHPAVHGGVFYPSSASLIGELRRYDIRPEDPAPAMVHLCVSDARVRKGGVLGLSSQLFPRDPSYQWGGEMDERAYAASEGAMAIRTRMENGKLPRLTDIRNALAGTDLLANHVIQRALMPWSSMRKGGWSQNARAVRRYSVFEVVQMAEQAPHAGNRILPSPEKDSLGQNRVTLDWRWHEADQMKTIAAQEVFEAAVLASGIGRIDHARPQGTLRVISSSSYHHIGGLRMGRDPKTSVTDADCRVHGTENLYVAGAGLFPTGSYANPTYLISVLAVRLAGHLGRLAAAAQSRNESRTA
jgi:choline dehydrogenase-like flavoprotein